MFLSATMFHLFHSLFIDTPNFLPREMKIVSTSKLYLSLSKVHGSRKGGKGGREGVLQAKHGEKKEINALLSHSEEIGVFLA